MGSWICSKHKIYVCICIKFTCIFFTRSWLWVQFYTVIWPVVVETAINPIGLFGKYNYMDDFFSRSAVVVVVFFLVAIFPFTTQSNEERMKAALSVNSECNINIANMKIRLKPTMMGEQRALTCQHVLLSFKYEVRREIHSISVNRMFSK